MTLPLESSHSTRPSMTCFASPFCSQDPDAVVNFLEEQGFPFVCLLCGASLLTSFENDFIKDLKYRLGCVLGVDESYMMPWEERVVVCNSCHTKVKEVLEVYAVYVKTREKLKDVSRRICNSVMSTHLKFQGKTEDFVLSEDLEEWDSNRIQKMLGGDFKLDEPMRGRSNETEKGPAASDCFDKPFQDVDTSSSDKSTDLEFLEDNSITQNSTSFRTNTKIGEGRANSHTLKIRMKAWKSRISKTSAKKSKNTLTDDGCSGANATVIGTTTSPKTFSCKECDKSFQSVYAIRSHKKVHIRENKDVNGAYRCTHCSQTFSNLEFLNSHKEFHEAERNFCTICNKQLCKGALKEHLHSHFKNDVVIFKPRCKLCSKIFDSPILLANHMDVHKGDFTCLIPSCRKSFYSESNLLQHGRVHWDESTLLGCDYCLEVLENLEDYDKHVLNHKKNSYEKSFLCDTCGQYFLTKLSLRRHNRNAHENSGEFSCKVCKKSFKTAKGLEKHETNHNKEVLAPYVCQQCKLSFKQKSALDNHMRKHSGIKSYQCCHCDTGFTYKQGLRQHVYKYHPNEYSSTKQFICIVCYKNFADEASLTDHNMVHERLKCKICDKQFRMMTHLKEHIIRHAAIRPYKCPYCPNKGYVRRKELTEHMEKIHPSQNPNVPQSENITYVIQLE